MNLMITHDSMMTLDQIEDVSNVYKAVNNYYFLSVVTNEIDPLLSLVRSRLAPQDKFFTVTYTNTSLYPTFVQPDHG